MSSMDVQVSKCLKDLPGRLQTGKLSQRQQIFADLTDLLTTQTLPENIVKGICKVMSVTLLRYNDAASRLLVVSFLELAASQHPLVCARAIHSALSDTMGGWRSTTATPALAKSALAALNWSATLLATAKELLDTEGKKVIEVQSNLVSLVMCSGAPKLAAKATKILTGLWEIEGLADKYSAAVLASEATVNLLVLASRFLGFLSSKQLPLDNIKTSMLEALNKNVVSSKTKTQDTILYQLAPLLKLVNRQEFSKIMLPVMSKALLRSPEIALSAVGPILSGLSIDLSQYAGDVSKPFVTSLNSADESTRSDAAVAMLALCRQCSDSAAIDLLLNSIFAVLNGSEGKISINAHKASLLSAAGSLTNSGVTGAAMATLANAATNHFVKILETEAHEGTLVTALEMLASWAAKFSNEIPAKLIAWFPKGMALKTTTSAVRCGYLLCLASALHSNTLASAAPLAPSLMKVVDNAVKQPGQVAIVSEAVHASACLVKLAGVDMAAEQNLADFFTIVCDEEKQLFYNEKFLAAAGPAALRSLSTLIITLLLSHTDKVARSCGPLYHALATCLLASSGEVRRHGQQGVKKLASTLGGAVGVASLASQMKGVMQNRGVSLDIPLRGELAPGGEAPASGPIPAGAAVAALTGLAGAAKYEAKEAEKVALALLPAAHFPAIEETYSRLWIRLVKNMGLNPVTFISNYQTDIHDILAECLSSNPEVSKRIIHSLVITSPGDIVPHVLDKCKEALGNPLLLNVTANDYQVYLTPPGVVYDNSSIENLRTDGKAQNIKRENKAYSYKEQMEEIALRKELEEKKKREGKLKAPELNFKQKEALKAQLEKESVIRENVTNLKKSSDPAMVLLSACIEGKPEVLAADFLVVLPLLYKAISSPVVAAPLSQIHTELRKSVFTPEDETLSQFVAGVTLQVLKPACESVINWKHTELKKSLVNVLDMIHKSTVPPKNGQDGDISCPLPSPAFTYCFPLIRAALTNHIKDEEVLAKGFEIISEHTALRGSDEEEFDLFHPQYLPRHNILNLLIEIISSSEGTTQQTAVKCLIDTAHAAGGGVGCALANAEEVESLLGALQNEVEAVRDAALRGLTAMVPALPSSGPLADRITRRVWVARCDPLPENKDLASELWTLAGLQSGPGLCLEVLEDVAHPVAVVRSAAAEALAVLLSEEGDSTGAVLTQLLETYEDKLEMTPAVMDSLSRIIQPAIDHWEPRSGIALALAKIAPFYSPFMVNQAASFFIPTGLGDRNEVVRKDMLDAAVVTIDLHGKETVTELLPVFEEFLDKAPDNSSYDCVRQSVVILMGSLARHLERDDPKVRPIIGKLVSALATPSQQVQEAVAKCLPPLVPSIKDEAPKLVNELLDTLLDTENFGERKGAAYGLAGLVKGLGILSLKQLDIMNRLTEALQNKKNHRHREGALFALSQLCSMLGRLFEPYIVHVLPHLLLCFGDSDQYVREATDDCAKAVMSKLSAHGVKLVLPSLLAALEEDQWRTKTGSVELLGAMAFCAPKQLSSCLPSIVPKLIEVLGDSHQKVQNAGAQALKQIGSVIRNPEIQAIVKVLLAALQDPGKKTGPCLQTLLDTKFVHFIDAPSLALIMPAVQRAFQDRSTETRKMAAQIIGNMYSLTDQKDLAPYLPGIIPGLKASLLDPVPEVRGVSARALGAMVRGMGESSFEELLPWLMSTLTSESSSVDRSGAAQGLAEVVGGLGVDKMHKLMPEIVSTAQRTDIAPHVKDGYIMMFIYMPAVFPDHFTQYIGQIVQPILQALADENEYVRDTALKAGQRIVNMYADSAISLLLPQLEQGLFDDNWRIRYSSIQLLGDLLYKISGVSGKMTTETASEDDNFGTEQSHKIIINMLGQERRNRVLAGLYMGRSDVALMVRQSALHVWKVIVTNTPRTLREILPTLFNLLLGCLASSSYDKRQVAARTLGDLVRKLGERVLPEIIPILEKGLESDQPDKRQGVCVGLSEIMTSTSRDMVLTFVDSLVPTVRKALCDRDTEVRQAAAKTFDSLHTTVGARALDDILPAMLNQLSDPDLHDDTLDGLRQIMAIKSRVVLPYLVPQLTATPVNTKALSILASVAGEALNKHLSKILPALLTALAESQGSPEAGLELQYSQAVVLSVTDELGVSYIMDILLESCKSSEVTNRRGAVTLLHAFCDQTKTDLEEYVPQLIRSLILLFTDKDQEVLKEAWNALNAVTKTLDAGAQMSHVPDVRQAVRFALSDMKDGDLLPGFCLPKGISPLLPIFRESILNGAPELKESASQGLGEVIKVTSVDALKPSVVHITGPLIRILGDRFSHNVKTAVLDTLAILLSKASAMLKPFLPQLQTTFLKALNDTNRTVRLKAGAALSHLITIHTRPDPLFNELHTGIKNSDDAGVRDTYLQALRGCVTNSGDKLSASIRRGVTATLLSHLSHSDDTTRSTAAGCLGSLMRWLPTEELVPVVTDNLLDDDLCLDWTVRHGRSALVAVALKEAPVIIYSQDWAPKVIRVILAHLVADRVPIASNGVRSAGFLLHHCLVSSKPLPVDILGPFVRTINHSSNDVKVLVTTMSSHLARSQDTILPPDLLKLLIPMLVNGTKEKNSMVKSSSESALVDVLIMRKGPTGQASAMAVLDTGARESLMDVVNRNLSRLAQQELGKEPELDDTVLV